MELSNNTIERICKIFGHLDVLAGRGVRHVSSRELAAAAGATEYTVRKDISFLGLGGYTRRGYDVVSLKGELAEKLDLGKKRRACIVGLGRLGSALLDYEKFKEDGFEIVAGFDRSINKIERLHTQIDVFAVSALKSVVVERKIELGIIAVPAEAAQHIADELAAAGVRGILNFSPVKLTVPKCIVYVDMDVTNALRFIAAKFAAGKG